MKKLLSAILLLTMLTASLASCGTGITVAIEYIVNGETYQTNTFSGKTMPSLAADPKSDDTCAVFDGWYYDENIWKEPLTLQSLQELQLKEKTSIKVYAHFKYEHTFEDGVCVNCNAKEEESSNSSTDPEVFDYTITTNFDGSSYIAIKGILNTDVTKLVVPENINQIPVTTILENTFFALEGLEEVIIPSTVEYVQSGAFVNCESLKKVSFLSKKMKTLYDGTFKGCPALETIAVENPIIIEEYLFNLASLKAIEFNGTLEESQNGLLLSNGSSKPGVIVKCTDGERLLSVYSNSIFYQTYSDKPSVHSILFRYAPLPNLLPGHYFKTSAEELFSVEQVENTYKTGELNGINYFVCDAATVSLLMEKNMLCGYDASQIPADSRVPGGYWDEFKKDGATYAFGVPVTNYSFEGNEVTIRGDAEPLYLVCLKASDGKSHIDETDMYANISEYFRNLIEYHSEQQ